MTETTVTLPERIAIDPRVMVGKPCIKGTRITVELIVHMIRDGNSFADILEDYPHLTKQDIEAALDYAGKLAGRPVVAA